MQSKSEAANRLRSDPHSFQPGSVYSEPWWRGVGYNPMAQTMSGANASNSSSEGPNGDSESNDEGQSLSNSGMNEEDDDATKDSQAADPNQSGNHGQEQQGVQHATSSAPIPQLELVGHSIACAPNPYQDPYYGGMMAAYGHQQLGYAPFIGMPHARMPLPLEMAQEPVLCECQTIPRILRRRQLLLKQSLKGAKKSRSHIFMNLGISML
uniref:Nuclear transcription factor Y subunit n=1 Tax=Lotus japonicus TaxID=34305 RepID=I3S0F4_LOTJA|nr:unknown [Lotus japonicus]